jgi:hypothetical protein
MSYSLQTGGASKLLPIVGVIVGIIVIVIIIIIVVKKPTPQSQASARASETTQAPPPSVVPARAPTPAPAPALAPVSAPVATKFTFYQGMDSNGNDIYQKIELADNVPGLSAHCSSLPNCKGFNTNAWIKHTISPQSAWLRWTSEPSKGLYVRN